MVSVPQSCCPRSQRITGRFCMLQRQIAFGTNRILEHLVQVVTPIHCTSYIMNEWMNEWMNECTHNIEIFLIWKTKWYILFFFFLYCFNLRSNYLFICMLNFFFFCSLTLSILFIDIYLLSFILFVWLLILLLFCILFTLLATCLKHM